MAALPWTDPNIVQDIDTRTWLIQRRLIAIMKLGNRPKAPPPTPKEDLGGPKVSNLDLEVEALGHTTQVLGKWSQCQVCGDTWSPQHRRRVVARGKCRGVSPWTQIPPALHCPWALPPNHRGIMFNGRVIHYSHRLMWHRGIIYCLHCGYYTSGQSTKRLAKKCQGDKPKPSQAPILKRMKRGVAPTSTGWPLPMEAQSTMHLKPYLN